MSGGLGGGGWMAAMSLASFWNSFFALAMSPGSWDEFAVMMTASSSIVCFAMMTTASGVR